MPGRKKMDIDTALMLARKIESQKREMGDPNVDGPRENDPMRVLQDQFYRGFNVPPGTEEQKQAYRDAIDQRLYTQGLRERRRAEAMAPSTRLLIADALRRGGLAASLTPYDVGLGDAAYAAGELIDPEGTYEDAALAAAGGVLTGGLGSGAILSKAAKEARDLQKAAEQAEAARKAGAPGAVVRNPGAVGKAPMPRGPVGTMPRKADVGIPSAADVIRRNPGAVSKSRIGRNVERADDFEDITPTVIQENPLNIKFPDDAVRGPRTRGPTGTPPSSARRSLEEVSKMSKAESDAYSPLLKKGIEYSAYAQRYGSGGRFPDFRPDMADIQSKIARSGRGPGPGPFGATLPEAIGMGTLAGVGGAMLATGTTPMEVQSRLLESIRASSDYGNAFSETMRMNTPDMYNSPEDLNDVGPMLQSAFSKALQISAQTGTVPIDLTRQIGKLEALQKTKETLEASDDLALQGGFMDPMKTSGFGDRVEARRQAVQSGRSLFEPSGFGDRIEAQRQAVQSGEPLFKPSMPIVEGPPMVGPADPTPEQMRQMDATREIVPSMEDFGE